MDGRDVDRGDPQACGVCGHACDDDKVCSQGACQDDCDLASTKPVIDAYDNIAKCVAAHPDSNTACQ